MLTHEAIQSLVCVKKGKEGDMTLMANHHAVAAVTSAHLYWIKHCFH